MTDGKVIENDFARLLKLMKSCAAKMKKTSAVMKFYVECHAGDDADTLIGLINGANELHNKAVIMREWIRDICKEGENKNDGL